MKWARRIAAYDRRNRPKVLRTSKAIGREIRTLYRFVRWWVVLGWRIVSTLLKVATGVLGIVLVVLL